MSATYYLICMDCGEVVDLGKAIKFREPKLKKEIYGFAFLNDGHDDVETSEMSPVTILTWRYLEHFLMRHRGHELRVLPGDLVEKYENDYFPVYAPGDPFGTDEYVPEESYYSSHTGKPNQEKDANSVPENVIKRLLEMHKGEKISSNTSDISSND
ncbi:hypothetical protein LV478_02030 (plasmid) [Komagataeibacter oboediens]|uniref:hypothetical protein n=1 Tax=Komagataeibacter oboediens TaxID=65958 RepID=UPI0023D9FB64|nr:hypothetical protein [Komagataeibacter oboediens]WEQ50803.1 hypothetical protein LV478_02030 [Komagataeibacter oboediens]